MPSVPKEPIVQDKIKNLKPDKDQAVKKTSKVKKPITKALQAKKKKTSKKKKEKKPKF